jgi:hypothetical protein
MSRPLAEHAGAERAPDRAVLSRSALMLLRRVLHAYREGWLLESRVAAAARTIADDARLHGLTAERMLVAMKESWGTLDDVRRLAPGDARALRDRLVTLAIRAFYAETGASDARRGGSSAA